MNNYLLSIDPSMKNTGFVLWERENKIHITKMPVWSKEKDPTDEEMAKEFKAHFIYKPIWVGSYNFNKYEPLPRHDNSFHDILYMIAKDNCNNCDGYSGFDFKDLYLVIEAGITRMIKKGNIYIPATKGKKKLDNLRGNIFGFFNKLYDEKVHGISPRTWQKFYLNNIEKYNAVKNIYTVERKWIKDLSFYLAEELIEENNWNITISNHDEAEALLIGWAKINANM